MNDLAASAASILGATSDRSGSLVAGDDGCQILAEFTVPSEPGNERGAMEEAASAVQGVDLTPGQLERLKTAVAEATMNAMEHGNRYQPDQAVYIRVLASEQLIAVQITDHGGGAANPEAQTPDLEAKLAGTQSPRGWGLFLIENMVDEMHVSSNESHHTVELIMKFGGNDDDV